jgi:hypothetical protein
MKSILHFLPFVLAASLVFIVNPALGGFAIWNLLPIGLGAVALGVAMRRRGSSSIALEYFAYATTCISFLAHLAWVLDWNATATGSSTSALIFIFLPIWALAIGAAVGALRWAIARTVGKAAARN